MVYPNDYYSSPCNRQEIFMTGFIIGYAFFILTYHLMRELCIFFKHKEAILRKDYELREESSESESSEQSVEEESGPLSQSNAQLNDSEHASRKAEKSCKVSPQENYSNHTLGSETSAGQNIHLRRTSKNPDFFCKEILPDLLVPKSPLPSSQIVSDTPFHEYPKYAHRSSGRYMTNREMEEVAENFRKEQVKKVCLT